MLDWMQPTRSALFLGLAFSAFVNAVAPAEAEGPQALPTRPAMQAGSEAVPLVPPQAIFEASCDGLLCTFDASESFGDWVIESYDWTFPGGATASGVTTQFFFHAYQQYSVTLTITATLGATDTVTNVVIPSVPAGLAPKTGSWSNPARSGNGISLSKSSTGSLALTWFTYLSNGVPTWYSTDAGSVSNAVWTKPLFKTTWNGSSATRTQVGTARIVFSNNNEAWFSWILNGVVGGERFRYLFGGAGRTGNWQASSQPGWPITVDELNGLAGVAVTFFDGSQPRWVLGSGPVSGDMTMSMLWFTGPGLCPGCNPSPPPATSQPAGSIRLQIPSGGSTSGFVSTSIVMPSGNTWNRTNLPITRLTGP